MSKNIFLKSVKNDDENTLKSADIETAVVEATDPVEVETVVAKKETTAKRTAKFPIKRRYGKTVVFEVDGAEVQTDVDDENASEIEAEYEAKDGKKVFKSVVK